MNMQVGTLVYRPMDETKQVGRIEALKINSDKVYVRYHRGYAKWIAISELAVAPTNASYQQIQTINVE
jgi:hypothetical protein